MSYMYAYVQLGITLAIDHCYIKLTSIIDRFKFYNVNYSLSNYYICDPTVVIMVVIATNQSTGYPSNS